MMRQECPGQRTDGFGKPEEKFMTKTDDSLAYIIVIIAYYYSVQA